MGLDMIFIKLRICGNMKKTLLLIPILVAVVVISGCTQTGEVVNQPICNDPYIAYDTGCCLDQNSNAICDSDESNDENIQTERCGDGTCQSSEDYVSCSQDCESISIEDLKTNTYSAIRKYVPESAVGEYEDDYTQNYACPLWSYYPNRPLDMNWSESVVTVLIMGNCVNGEVYTPEYMLSITGDGQESNTMYLKTINGHTVLITDTVLEFDQIEGEQGRYDFSIGFTCDNHWINIHTRDFYGEDIYPLYETYDIDRVAMENIVSEILDSC